jgi:hypothetical protein
MVVNSATLISDSVIFIRDLLRDNVTDPLFGTRNIKDKFVHTSYPRREVNYPVLTVKHLDMPTTRPLGMGVSEQILSLTFEIRVWARNVVERDEMTQAIYHLLRTQQYTATGTRTNKLHDFYILSAVDVDEEGEQAIRSKVLTIKYMFITET